MLYDVRMRSLSQLLRHSLHGQFPVGQASLGRDSKVTEFDTEFHNLRICEVVPRRQAKWLSSRAA